MAETTKQSKRDARQQWEHSRQFFQAGDYGHLRQLDSQLAAQAADSEYGEKAQAELQRLSPDPWAIRAGIASVVIYIIAWILALN